jgi:peptidoglycan/xylan/chitin deacetylase (PgdA/CDA1 family)
MHSFRTFTWGAALAAAGFAVALAAALPAQAEDCPGNPNALGTSRVIPIDFADYQRVGTLNYPRSVPLADHEVVLTFDDGPLPPYTNQILATLAAQCIKANYVMVGSMAHAYPDAARRVHDAGHTIGTHSQTHPLRMGSLPVDKMDWQIDQGIANVDAALGDPSELAPFFRIPGFARSNLLEQELAARSLIVFSTDVVADDWHRGIKPAKIISLAISRLEKRGRGMLLLHDIHPATAAALPGLLQQLKEHGFHIVQIVPAPPNAPAVMTASADDSLNGFVTDASARQHWPVVSADTTPDAVELAAPDAKAFTLSIATAASPFPAASAADATADARTVAWPSLAERAPPAADPELAAPSIQDISLSSLPSRRDGEYRLGLRPGVEVLMRTHRHAHAVRKDRGHQHADLISGLIAALTPSSQAGTSTSGPARF